MDEQRQDDQLEPIYNSFVPIQDIALKISREQWMIEKDGGSGPGRSVLAWLLLLLFVLDRNTWYHITVCKQMIIIIKLES